MDEVAGDKAKRRRGASDDDRLWWEARVKFWCPGCKTMVVGLREFSHHKVDCEGFWRWLDEFFPKRRQKRRHLHLVSDLEDLHVTGGTDD